MFGMKEDESCPKEKEQSITFLHVKIERKNYDIDKINDLVRKSVKSCSSGNCERINEPEIGS